jgi:hypothetical protein
LYSGASACDLAMNAACASASSGGEAVVRVATGLNPECFVRLSVPSLVEIRGGVFNERMTVSKGRGPREPRSDAARNHEALAQPRQADPDWDATCRRLLATFIEGLRTARGAR